MRCRNLPDDLPAPQTLDGAVKQKLLTKIKTLIGNVRPEQLVHVESFIGDRIGVFIPSTGHCYYSVSENHTHPSYSFHYSYEKAVRISLNGKVETSKKGRISCIPPSLPHNEIASEQFTRFIALLIDKDFFEEQCAVYEYRPDMNTLTDAALPENLMPCIKQFMIEASGNAPGSRELIRALEMQITHLLLRSLCNVPINTVKISQRADIDYVVEYINDNYAKPLYAEELAETIAMSRSHFSRVFKKETGMSVQAYIVTVRLARARLYLAKEDKKLTEIAYLCGFSSSAHFSACFSKKFRMTPSQFRARL